MIKAIKFTKEELKWIERTADIESSRAMMQFTNMVNKINLNKLNKKEKEMTQKITTELIDLYTFLKGLRTKLELWDCRYDINKGFKTEIKPS